MPKLEASVLAFERKLANSDALMYAGNWTDIDSHNGWEAITIQEKAIRGTISNRMKSTTANDPAKVDAEIQKPNLQRVDIAALPPNKDTLKISFTLRVLGGLSTPSACNNPNYQAALKEKIDGYINTQGFGVLASRYAENLASGRFLWRNRVGTEKLEIRICRDEQQWKFDGHAFNLRKFSNDRPDLISLSAAIEDGLAGQNYVLLTVDAFAKMGPGQEVFPSQELLLDKSKSERSKVLYHVRDIAALHSQKIGNAIRTIDTWHPEADALGPIAVEPYGSVTNRGTAYRQPKDKIDFYSLLDSWIGKDSAPENEQQHYVMATLIRGGVFGKAD